MELDERSPEMVSKIILPSLELVIGLQSRVGGWGVMLIRDPLRRVIHAVLDNGNHVSNHLYNLREEERLN
jgi:hypothetical protein